MPVYLRLSGTIVLLAGLFPWLALHAAEPRTVLVSANGSAQFRTVQAAVDTATGEPLTIRIAPGTYKEKIHIPADHVTLIGTGRTPADTVLTYDDSAKTAGGTSNSPSVTITGDDFTAENLTVANTWEKEHPDLADRSQAVALKTTGDRGRFLNVRFLGYQDTLYAASKSCHTSDITTPCQAARDYFRNCYIEGHVDYIFGDAKAVFDHCELHAMPHSMVTITAQSRLYPAEDSGYTFLDCKLTGEAGAEHVYFGRPWRPYSTVEFINSDIEWPLEPNGWLEWAGKLKTSTYQDGGSHGKGALSPTRIPPSRILTPAEMSKFTVKSLLAGNDHWDPTAGLPPHVLFEPHAERRNNV
jgi:pectinesterase